MSKPSDVVKEYLGKVIEQASEGRRDTDVLKLINYVNQMIDDLADHILDQEITFGDKFQAIADMKYLGNFLESTMSALEKEDLIKLISDDPYHKIIDFIKEPPE